MKILLSSFFHRYADVSFSVFYDLYTKLIKWFPKEKTEVKFLTQEDYYEIFTNTQELQCSNIEAVSIKTEDLIRIFNQNVSGIDFWKRLHKIGLEQAEKEKFKKLVREALGEWEPDVAILIGTMSSSALFGDVFPNTLCLTQESAMFSRSPFLLTRIYDPFNSMPYNFMTKFSNEIRNFKITKKEDRKVENFKKKLTSIIDKTSFIDKEMIKYKKQFKKLVLLPLSSNFFIKLFSETKYNNEKELIEDVMQNTPSDIGVFVTQHNAFYSLKEKDIDYYSNKYKNFLFLRNTNSREFVSNSLHYFKHVDAIINSTSKTALMGLLWDIPVLSLAKTSNEAIKDGQGMQDLQKVLNTKPKKNNILYWYLTHYAVFEPYFLANDYMYNYFEQKINYFRKNGIDFSYYNKINDMNDVSEKMITCLGEKFLKGTFEYKINKLPTLLKIIGL